jgi:transcriptional regulator with XRE-family HTH domain
MILDRRQRARLTQQEVANLAGWSQKQVSQIETGSHRMTVLELVELAEALKFDPMTVIRRIMAIKQDD